MPKLKEKLRSSLVEKQGQQKKEWTDYRSGKGKKPEYASGVMSMPESHYDKMFGTKPAKKGGK